MEFFLLVLYCIFESLSYISYKGHVLSIKKNVPLLYAPQGLCFIHFCCFCNLEHK